MPVGLPPNTARISNYKRDAISSTYLNPSKYSDRQTPRGVAAYSTIGPQLISTARQSQVCYQASLLPCAIDQPQLRRTVVEKVRLATEVAWEDPSESWTVGSQSNVAECQEKDA